MKKIYCIKYNKYRKFRSPQISCNFDKAVVPSIICDKRGSNDKKIIENESIEILEILILINNMNK